MRVGMGVAGEDEGDAQDCRLPGEEAQVAEEGGGSSNVEGDQYC